MRRWLPRLTPVQEDTLARMLSGDTLTAYANGRVFLHSADLARRLTVPLAHVMVINMERKGVIEVTARDGGDRTYGVTDLGEDCLRVARGGMGVPGWQTLRQDNTRSTSRAKSW